jgi:hypothetical protein
MVAVTQALRKSSAVCVSGLSPTAMRISAATIPDTIRIRQEPVDGGASSNSPS